MVKRRTSNSQEEATGKKNITEKKQQVKSSRESTKPPQMTKEVSIRQTKNSVVPTYEQISERAREIWNERGCLPGEDERNWLEAENQLLSQEAGKR